MSTHKTLSLLMFVMVGITLLGESPSAYARHRRRHYVRRQTSASAPAVDVRKELADAGFSVNDRLYNSCANAGDRSRGVLREHTKFLEVILKSFTRSYCRPGNDSSKIAMASGTRYQDALRQGGFPQLLAEMQQSYKVADLGGTLPAHLSSKVNDGLIDTYSMLFGLAARESTWNFAEGADRSVRHRRRAYEIEAGAFQTSYNVHSCLGKEANSALTSLEKSYAGASSVDCMGGSGGTPDASSDASSFQVALKSCPALAVEDAAITIRHCRNHYGPLIRGEAKKFESCKPLLKSLAEQAEADPNICDTLQIGGRPSNSRVQYASSEDGVAR